MDIASYHLNFVNEEYDSNGILSKFEIKYPDNFNFAYDIIDKYAEIQPDRRAVMWVDLEGNERLFTFGDLSRLSNKTLPVLVCYDSPAENRRNSYPRYTSAYHKGLRVPLRGG